MMTATSTQNAAQPEIEDIAAQLAEYLSRPVQVGGPREPRPPEYDIIDAARKGPHSEDAKLKLSGAASTLLAMYVTEINGGDLSAGMTSRMARLGYLCSTLRLDVDGTAFYLLGLLLIQAASFGRTVDVHDLFQILRAAGRSDAPKVPAKVRELFWQSVLGGPHKGMRTLAAQNLVRLDPGLVLADLPRFLEADVNEPLVAHELLQQLGTTDLVNTAASRLDATTLRRMGQALADAGHSEAAAMTLAREAMVASEMTLRPSFELAVRSVGVGGIGGPQAVAFRGLPLIVGLVASGRSRTVQRFMSRGGIAPSSGYLAAVTSSQNQFYPPALVVA